MPNTQNWWKKIKNIFLPSTDIEKLKRELQKEPAKQQFNRIQALVRAMCLKQENIPISIFQAYPELLIRALETIIQEPPYDKKIIYHDIDSEFYKTQLHPGEVHCKKYNHPLGNAYGEYWHGIEYHLLDIDLIPERCYLETQIQSLHREFVYPPNHPQNKLLLEADLTEKGFILTNIPLIKHARSNLENYYFTLANDSFRQSHHPASLEKALKACLHLSSSEDDFNTQFKTTIIEAYLAKNMGNMESIPPIIFSQLKTSHQHPEETFEALKIEKQRGLVA